jgi:hypothetical protein
MNQVKYGLIALITIFSSVLLLERSPSYAQSTIDFLVQEVCADNSTNVAVYADPYSCPAGTTARKLALGEPLPYHKIDASSAQPQISDSFPTADRNGITTEIQTYYYPGGGNGQPLDSDWTSGNVYLAPYGGYNIIGTDGSNIFFRGTWDGGSGWAPWWTSSCAAAGWVLFPKTTISGFGYGTASSGTEDAPNCTGGTNTSNVEFNVGTITFDNGHAIQAVYDFHWSDNNFNASTTAEANYFTQIYGVTRWEAWSQTPGVSDAMANCPHAASYTATLHGSTYYMKNCRDWAQIAAQPATPWNPAGTADYDSTVLTWPIDPLYNSTNILLNTHFQPTPVGMNPSSCDISNWNRSYTSPVLNWGWDTSAVAPMHGTTANPNYNCALQFSVPSAPNGDVVYQQQSIGAAAGTFTYGTTLWSPGTTGQVYVAIIGRDGSGNVTDNTGFYANTGNQPRTFGGSFSINSSTRTIFLAMYPQTAGVGFDFSGAWIAKAP